MYNYGDRWIKITKIKYMCLNKWFDMFHSLSPIISDAVEKFNLDLPENTSKFTDSINILYKTRFWLCVSKILMFHTKFLKNLKHFFVYLAKTCKVY